MKPIVEFALASGCRAGEILGLEWSRVDLTRKVAWLDHGTTKSGDGRGIPLNADAVTALEATLGQNPRWCLTFAGKRIQQSSTAWGLAKQRAGIEAHLGLLARAERHFCRSWYSKLYGSKTPAFRFPQRRRWPETASGPTPVTRR
jgi:integrase